MIESPQSFVVVEECRKAASQNGYRRELGEHEGWAHYGSTTARGTIYLAATGPNGPWHLALDHPGVVEELGLKPTDMPGPAISRFAFTALGDLYSALDRAYNLALALPDSPLKEFRMAAYGLPQQTEAERLTIQRVGQDIFRNRLFAYWEGRCPLTGITEPALLRASHIIPWKDCPDDSERLNIYNGLLLSALWDAAFDRGLVTFENDGKPKIAPSLGDAARSALRWHQPIALTDQHRARLSWHRAERFTEDDDGKCLRGTT